MNSQKLNRVQESAEKIVAVCEFLRTNPKLLNKAEQRGQGQVVLACAGYIKTLFKQFEPVITMRTK